MFRLQHWLLILTVTEVIPITLAKHQRMTDKATKLQITIPHHHHQVLTPVSIPVPGTPVNENNTKSVNKPVEKLVRPGVATSVLSSPKIVRKVSLKEDPETPVIIMTPAQNRNQKVPKKYGKPIPLTFQKTVEKPEVRNKIELGKVAMNQPVAAPGGQPITIGKFTRIHY